MMPAFADGAVRRQGGRTEPLRLSMIRVALIDTPLFDMVSLCACSNDTSSSKNTRSTADSGFHSACTPSSAGCSLPSPFESNFLNRLVRAGTLRPFGLPMNSSSVIAPSPFRSRLLKNCSCDRRVGAWVVVVLLGWGFSLPCISEPPPPGYSVLMLEKWSINSFLSEL